MLGAAPPVTFVATTDGDAARAFYEGVLGLTFVEDQGFALVFDLAGTPLRVTRVESFTPLPFTVLGWQPADIDASVRALTEGGVTFERFDGLEQDDLGIWSASGGTRVAWFRDPDGNTLSLSTS
jgi:catechol 2,3-dioxygenase-like lactoylglutathione lyase family enzyme